MDSRDVGDRIDRASRHPTERQPRAMSALPEKAPGRQRDVSALRLAVKKRRRIAIVVVAVFAIAALSDWTGLPSKQVSAVLYETSVIKGYRTFLQSARRRFIRRRF